MSYLGLSASFFNALSREAEAGRIRNYRREAMFYKKLSGNAVQCEVCFRECSIKEGERGTCRNKENRKGKLFNLVHSLPSAVHVDPIEKEPSLHMLPGTDILAIGTAGCNFRCKFCHNWHLSQRPIEDMDALFDVTPEKAISLATRNKAPTISFTYNEPTSFFEYAYDIAVLARKKGLRILCHTNGALKPEPLKAFLKYADAVTVDLKGFTEEFYSSVSEAQLEPVLETLKVIRREGVWLEIVSLIVSTLNDKPDDVERMCLWIKENLGADTPLHFSRFFPTYKLTTLPPTPISTLERCYGIAKKCGLNYVTIGNVPGHKHNSTFCPGCGKNIIHRMHFSVEAKNIQDGKCKFCGREIPGIWA